MIDKTIEVERMEHVISVFGSFDQNLRIIESELSVKVLDRENMIHICGEAENVMLAEKAINGLLTLAAKGENIDAQNVRYILKLVSGGKETKISQLAGDVVCITAKGKPIKPKTLGQKAYLDALKRCSMVFAVGPAGTGKTYLAVAMALSMFAQHQVKRIVLTRPAVEAGERLGFLPGDLEEKVNPYLRPLYDALNDMLPQARVASMLESGAIEVAPLAFMRGRTLNDAFIILDEAQNTTAEQMKMFLTRMGFGSRMVVTGDPSQVDLPMLPGPSRGQSGLVQALQILANVKGIAFHHFQKADVVRHPLVGAIVHAYDEAEARR